MATMVERRPPAGSLLEMYRQMLTIRRFEELCLRLSQEDAVAGSVHLCAGHEAVPVGALAALDNRDQVVATYRGHGWAIACGVPLEGLLAEVCHKEIGVNGGRGGSAYLMAPQYRFLGETSIVGAGVPIADGAAIAAQFSGEGGVVLVSFGDGAISQGATHEGMIFAVARQLPVLFVCENNGWSEMTKTESIIPLKRLSDRASVYGMPGVSIDGTNPVTVHEAILAAAQRARAGSGPTLIECRVPRVWGHYNRDIEHYRPDDDRKAAQSADPLTVTRAALALNGGATDEDLLAIESDVDALIERAAHVVALAPDPDPTTARLHVVSASSESDRCQRSGPVVSREMPYWQAVNEALATELEERPDVLIYGEDVGVAGGIFGVTRRLQERFGSSRIFDTPIAESAILGSAVGAALRGLRPVVEIMWVDFLLVALDQLVNQAANLRYISQGERSLPLVVRTQQGITPGSCAQHSQSLEALLAHIPGLKIGLPACSQDAYAMLRAAVADPDPCVIIESRALYLDKGPVIFGADIEGVGSARVVRAGSDIAIVSWGAALRSAREAVEMLQLDGINAALLDLRWLSPLDTKTIQDVLTDVTGGMVIVHEANITGGFGAEVIATIVENAPEVWGARRVRRVGLPNVRVPASPALQSALVPNAVTVASAAKELLMSPALGGQR